MKITVLGLWHLGCVTAACTARHFEVVGFDFDAANVADLQKGKAPLFEPGLDDLLQARLSSGRLRFTTDINEACSAADILWITHDTPVDDNDLADSESVLREVRRCVPLLPRGALVLISAQLPVGTCRLLDLEFGSRGYRFACSPENLRLGEAIAMFENADRIVVGYRDEKARAQLEKLFSAFTKNIMWMSPESAEMTKHAINSFFALSIAFMNEVALLCEATGADIKEVERGLKSEGRIGPRAYLSAGLAFAGGTLARDVVTIAQIAKKCGEAIDIIPAIKRSNDRHRLWALQKIQKIFHGEVNRRIALLGLTYKPGTNTLRRSSAVELAHALAVAGYEVRAYDPSQPPLPSELGFIQFKSSAAEALDQADAVVVCTAWPEFCALDWPALIARLRRPLLLDAARLLEKYLADLPKLRYITVGSSA